MVHGTEWSIEDPEIAVAARWWREQAGRLGSSGVPTVDLAVALQRDNPQYSAEQLDRFEMELRTALVQFAAEGNTMGTEGKICIRVDYEPPPPIENAMKAAGVEGLEFPIKNVTWIEHGRVSVRTGYGRAPEVIYGRPLDPSDE